ncbi:hypothetical protein pmac_cds_780 [Pandoravirus macleodensis]|uniref:Uncharacterized protein n=1 Tax=Pandoravirus macleodensis TaxID=2107707 RepID=A0A2U7UG33_9VIRU|nr:hypothetical protein pmac_cds_780 [Pandoravirus macleodensis]AVK77468.1 hypothetical protein pmac_cds_780 [Pandoravirus macleodensis]
MERAASTDLLDRIRNELGPWREHSAIKRVIVVDDDQAPDGVRIVFEVSAWPAARCQLPTAMWIGALGGRRVPIEHTAIQDDPPWYAFSCFLCSFSRFFSSILIFS